MNKIDVLNDLSVLTEVSKLSLQNLADKSILAISHGVFEGIQNQESQTEFDIGIGILYIRLEGDAIKYKFIPSKNMEETIAYTVKNKTSALAIKADRALGERIENAYRCLL